MGAIIIFSTMPLLNRFEVETPTVISGALGSLSLMKIISQYHSIINNIVGIEIYMIS